MTRAVHIILDDAAMVAAGHGNVMASRLITRAHAGQGWFLYAPVCALVEADRARPGTAEHIAALPGITVVELALPAALAIARARTWAFAHTRYEAQPTPDRTAGAAVATAAPDNWKSESIRIIDLTP